MNRVLSLLFIFPIMLRGDINAQGIVLSQELTRNEQITKQKKIPRNRDGLHRELFMLLCTILIDKYNNILQQLTFIEFFLYIVHCNVNIWYVPSSIICLLFYFLIITS